MDRIAELSSQIIRNDTNGFQGNIFEQVQLAPPDPILGTALAYKADTSKDKMNLGVGAYRDDNEKPYPFKVVRKVESQIVNDHSIDKEYLPIDGLAQFNAAAQQLIFGKDSTAVKDGRVITSQAISGTGALRIGFEFLAKFYNREVLVSNPTWGNHHDIIKSSGLNFKQYRYYNPKNMSLDFNGMFTDISMAKPGSIVLLHACAHNPTGLDLTEDQWKRLAGLFKQNRLFPFFDSAYQGFATGDLNRDAYSIRLFTELGFQLIVTQSFAKNMGLYSDRIGAFHLVCANKETAAKCLSQLKLVIRPMYSNPPAHGARIATKILTDPTLYNEWMEELSMVSRRIIDMRTALKNELVRLEVPGNWNHIVTQIGMFSYTGLTPEQVEILINKYHIYLLKNGRISMCGITTKNVGYLAAAIKDAVLSTQKK
ncbi:class I/II aminotransferase (macronuclear) [Tetrahymena thermophila SB210]|uniref:aspartate transaminase n=1 Tax=Tetrahymena thermophila (strain SB210) TaxID=312017 RepID=Q23JV0_TETTS|nr:class I/II aminotransferase [Tetrahymena thermophila SB210]EAR96809.2 class I/II aminotransferase [Tetrahymena thermophila SB210]|eukprot:XP_001017054.2 class I/II aminotransferase [Tetrahymena thermophila SB210]